MPASPPTFRHKTDGDFWILFRKLSPEIQKFASKNFELLKRNSRHPSLQFKKVGKVWSVRVGLEYRAMAVPLANGFLWFWIGRHDEYEHIIGS